MKTYFFLMFLPLKQAIPRARKDPGEKFHPRILQKACLLEILFHVILQKGKVHLFFPYGCWRGYNAIRLSKIIYPVNAKNWP
jgi:hypothetical protein